jgi:phosphoribosyl-dephospho-CoA transferase
MEQDIRKTLLLNEHQKARRQSELNRGPQQYKSLITNNLGMIKEEEEVKDNLFEVV